MKNILGIIGVIIVIALVAFGGFQLERWFKYKFGYQAKVQAEVQPLAKRVTELEKRVTVLETQLAIKSGEVIH